MSNSASLHIDLPPELSARITAYAAKWGSTPAATAIYCLMARFPPASVIEATKELAGAFPSRDAHAPFERTTIDVDVDLAGGLG